MTLKHKRYFNTSGPNIRERHYTLERKELVEEGAELVRGERYFTIWAPRQAGKSTYFRLLAEQMQQLGYKVCHVNFENYRNQSEADFLHYLGTHLLGQWQINVECTSFGSLTTEINSIKDEKCVLIIDEVEGINALYINDFLHTIRNLYHSRQNHCLKSVILVGVSNITGIIQDNASPFNIADNLQVDYFTQKEVFELFEMHEKETGQLFTEEVKEKIHSITAGQPGLVNGFGYKLVERCADKQILEYSDYLEIEKNYISIYPDKNISNIINKGKKYRAFVEKLLFSEQETPFDIYDERIRELSANGLITSDENRNIIFKVPLYKKCLQSHFYPKMNGEADQIRGNIWWEDYFLPNGKLNLEKIMREYQSYANKRGFKYFIEYDENGKMKGLKEAALVYSFETYIQAFLQAVEGKSYLEAHVALGRSDLIINVRGHEAVVEAKLYYDVARFVKGKTQIAYYTKKLGLDKGIYLVFVDKNITHPKVAESVENIEGVEVTTYLVRYDLDKDF